MSSVDEFVDESACMENDEQTDTQEDPSKSYFEEHPGYRFFHLGNIHRVFEEGDKNRNAKNLSVED